MQPVNSPISFSGTDRTAQELEHRPLGQLVAAADDGGGRVDRQLGAVMAESQAADRLGGVVQRGLDEMRLGDLRRDVVGRHGDGVDVDVGAPVDHLGQVTDVLLGRRAQLTRLGVNRLDALGEVGVGDPPALEDDVLVGRAAAEHDLGGGPADRLFEHVLGMLHHVLGAVDLAAAVGEEVERLVVLDPEAGASRAPRLWPSGWLPARPS